MRNCFGCKWCIPIIDSAGTLMTLVVGGSKAVKEGEEREPLL